MLPARDAARTVILTIGDKQMAKANNLDQLPLPGFRSPKLHAHSGPLIALVEAGILGASGIDDFGVKLQLLCFHGANRANHHIQQNNAVFFARHSVGVAYDHLIAMLAH